MLEADLLAELVRLVRLSRRLRPVPCAERDVDEAAADGERGDLVAERDRLREQRLEQLARVVETALVHAQQRERHARAAVAEECVLRFLELERTREQLGRVAPGPELPERQPREDVDDEPPVPRPLGVIEREAAVLERGDHSAQRPRLAEQQVHPAAHDVVLLDFEQRPLGELERRLEIGAAVREPDEDVRALVARRKLVEQLSQDGIGTADRARAEVRVGERELSAA